MFKWACPLNFAFLCFFCEMKPRFVSFTFPVVISMTTHARLQMSAARPCPSPSLLVNTSGAINAREKKNNILLNLIHTQLYIIRLLEMKPVCIYLYLYYVSLQSTVVYVIQHLLYYYLVLLFYSYMLLYTVFL